VLLRLDPPTASLVVFLLLKRACSSYQINISAQAFPLKLRNITTPDIRIYLT